MKTARVVDLFLYKLTFFETCIIYLEPTNKLIIGSVDCKSYDISDQDNEGFNFPCIFWKYLLLNVTEQRPLSSNDGHKILRLLDVSLNFPFTNVAPILS